MGQSNGITLFKNSSGSGSGSGSTVNYLWSGYHSTGNTGSNQIWTTTSTTFANPTNNNTNIALTQVNNTNFGTVSGWGANSGASALPGIIFTPDSSLSVYYVVATVTLLIGTGQDAAIRLWDGTITINSSQAAGNSANNNFVSCTLAGTYFPASTSSKTLQIQLATTGGTAALSDAGILVSQAGGHSIEWTIYKISAQSVSTSAAPRSYIRVSGASVTGSTDTQVVYFPTTDTSVGTDLSISNTAANGTKITINSDGIYSIDTTLRSTGATSTNFYISKNTTTAAGVASSTDILSQFRQSGSNFNSPMTVVTFLSAGDIIRVLDDFDTSGISNAVLYVTRIS